MAATASLDAILSLLRWHSAFGLSNQIIKKRITTTNMFSDIASYMVNRALNNRSLASYLRSERPMTKAPSVFVIALARQLAVSLLGHGTQR
jgi:hypothetical protein